MAGEEPVWALPSGLMYPGCARLAVLHSRIWLKAEASGSWMEGAWSHNSSSFSRSATSSRLFLLRPRDVDEPLAALCHSIGFSWLIGPGMQAANSMRVQCVVARLRPWHGQAWVLTQAGDGVLL